MVRLHLLSGSAFLELLHSSILKRRVTFDRTRPSRPTTDTFAHSPLFHPPHPDTMFKATSLRAMQPTRMMFMRQTAPMYMRQTARMMKPVPVR